MNEGFIYNDGGRAVAGFKGHTGDCVTRSVTIASGRDYADVYAYLANATGQQRATKRTGKRAASARNGVNVKRLWFKEYMTGLGFEWFPTMTIGSGCTVHLIADELPPGRLVVSVSRHYTAMIDGIIHDTYDPRRETWLNVAGPDDDWKLNVSRGETRNANGVWRPSQRCVYGYWKLNA